MFWNTNMDNLHVSVWKTDEQYFDEIEKEKELKK